MRFKNREHAADLLVKRLSPRCDANSLVLGVPRGALPMAKIIAGALGSELDVALVHKLSHPESAELAIGAIDETGKTFVFGPAADVDPEYLEAEKRRQLLILQRRRDMYTPFRPPIDPQGRTAVVVDDGIATGATMIAALRATRAHEPKKLICAVAVASPEAARAILRECDFMICLSVPDNFHAVGQFFDDFGEVTDEDVVRILKQETSKVAAAG